jgi:acetoacetyl-CoA synthetase
MWTPSAARVEASNLTRFMAQVKADWGVDCADDMDYEALHRWSVSELERFWSSVWRFCGVIGDLNETPVLVDGEKMPGARFFPEAQLNFAENLLRQRGPGDAMVFWGEDQVKRRVSHDELFDGVARLAAALKALGVGPGDRVAGFMPNLPETVMATLATASLGAIWSSCSPDFGVQGVLDRFGQIEPKVLFCPDGPASCRACSRSSWCPTPRSGPTSRPWIRPSCFPMSWRPTRPMTSLSSPWRSTRRSSSCIPRAPPVSPSASFTVPAAPC